MTFDAATTSSDDTVATATIDDKGMVTITAGDKAGMAEIIVTAVDSEGATGLQKIMVTVNAAPAGSATLTAVSLTYGGMTADASAMVSSDITDGGPTGDKLSFEWSSSDDKIASVMEDDTDDKMATVTAMGAGTATITATASDMHGGTATQTVMVNVNAMPMTVGSIDAVTLDAGAMSDAMDVSSYFSDTEGDTLTYTVMSSMTMYATANIPADSSMLTITGVGAGTATITVTATDMAGATATQDIAVTVNELELTAPTNVTASAALGAGTLLVKWDTVPAAAGYVVIAVSRSDPETDYKSQSVTDPDRGSVSLTGLTPGVEYNVFVAAYDDDLAHELSEPVKVTAQ